MCVNVQNVSFAICRVSVGHRLLQLSKASYPFSLLGRFTCYLSSSVIYLQKLVTCYSLFLSVYLTFNIFEFPVSFPHYVTINLNSRFLILNVSPLFVPIVSSRHAHYSHVVSMEYSATDHFLGSLLFICEVNVLL